MPPDEEKLNEDEIESILSFDPFEKGTEDEKKAGDKGTGEGQEPAPDVASQEAETESDGAKAEAQERGPDGKFAEADGKKGQAQEAEAAGKPPAEQVKDAEKEAMKATISALQEQVGALQKSKETVQPTAKKGAEIELPNHTVDIPEHYLKQLESEDPEVRRQALGGLVKATADMVYTNAVRTFRSEIGQVLEALPGLVYSNSSAVNEMRSWHDDYYSKFPTHSQIKEIVARETAGLMRELGYMDANGQQIAQFGWDNNLRDAIGNRVNQVIAGFRQPAETPAQKPPNLSKPGARPASPGAKDVNSPAGVADVLGLL